MWPARAARVVAVLSLAAASCVLINDSDEFVIESSSPPEPGAAGSVSMPPGPDGDDCRLAGVSGTCAGLTPLTCLPSGEWRPAFFPCELGCDRGECYECVPGTGTCSEAASTRRRCSESGRWENAAPCGLGSPLCRNGDCVACNAGQRTCIDNVPQLCGDDAQWHAEAACVGGQTCVLTTGTCATCSEGETRSCVNTIGNCASGTQRCLGDGTWSVCSIVPGEDSCDLVGDDADCDGRPNSPSAAPCPVPCSAGIACGPATEQGECARGTSACVDGALTACAGAVWPKTRDCRSMLDNDCNGTPDQLDATCGCIPNETPTPCPDSPYPAVGMCRPTVRRCLVSAAGTSSTWEVCGGGVGPQARDCTSTADNDCDGTPDDQSDSCECSVGVTSPCSSGGASGIRTCRISAAGDATFWSECAVVGN
jgi:hypothetical protein